MDLVLRVKTGREETVDVSLNGTFALFLLGRTMDGRTQEVGGYYYPDEKSATRQTGDQLSKEGRKGDNSVKCRRTKKEEVF